MANILAKNSSYNQILRSTSILGGSQIIIIIIGMIRTKIIAILLGPAGIGVIGVFQSIIDMMRSIYGLGLDTAGVRDIANANSAPDKHQLDKTTTIFLRWFRALALLGSLTCAIFCYPISIWTFGSGKFTLPVAILSISILFAILTTGHSSVLQGMRRIGDMAKSSMLSSFIGLLITAPLYFFFGLKGITPAFLLTNIASFLCVELYYRKLHIKTIKIPFKQVFKVGATALKFSIYIVIAGIIGTISMYAVRAFLINKMGIDAAGLFQAAWVITNIYLGLILRSMGSDFFPRLSALANENDKIKELVNEQSYIVLAIASPVIIGILMFSDFAISVFYSSDFIYADGVLRWQIAGTFFKVLAWPMAFIMLAKNKGALFLLTEVIFYGAYLLSSYLLLPQIGLDATGVGYLIAYIIYLPIIYLSGRFISRFSWNKEVIPMIVINIIFIAIAFYVTHYKEDYMFLAGIALLILSLVYSYFKIKKVFNFRDIKDWFKKR